MKYPLLFFVAVMPFVMYAQHLDLKSNQEQKLLTSLDKNIYSLNLFSELRTTATKNAISKKAIEIINQPDYSGFSVDKNGNLTAYASKYDYKEFVSSIEVIQIQSEYVAIASIDQGQTFGIIDQKGNIYNHFDFKFETLELNTFFDSTKTRWFFFKDKIGNSGFISNRNRVKEFNLFDELNHNAWGYPIVKSKKNRKIGVYNLREMKWFYDLKKQNEMEELFASSNITSKKL